MNTNKRPTVENYLIYLEGKKEGRLNVEVGVSINEKKELLTEDKY